MQVALREVTLEDLVELYPRRRGEAETLTLDDTIKLFSILVEHGSAYTALADGKPIAAGGVQRIDTGVGAALILGTDDLSKHPKEFTELMIRMRDQLMDDLELHRLQCDVLMSKPEWIRWTEYLGFKKEGVMRQLRDKQDCALLAYIREEEAST